MKKIFSFRSKAASRRKKVDEGKKFFRTIILFIFLDLLRSDGWRRRAMLAKILELWDLVRRTNG